MAHSSFGILYIYSSGSGRLMLEDTDDDGEGNTKRRGPCAGGGQMNIWPAYCDTWKEGGREGGGRGRTKNQPNALGKGRPRRRRRRRREGGLHDPRTYAMHAAAAADGRADGRGRAERVNAHGK